MQELSTGALFVVVLGRGPARRMAKLTRLRELRVTSVGELTAVYGLSEGAAKKALAIVELARRIDGDKLDPGTLFTGSGSVFGHARALGMCDLQVEQFRTLVLDGKNRLVGDVLVSQGTLTASPVHPREVFHPAIRLKGAAVVLMHNHPSGDPSPSADDLEITRRLVAVGDMVGIRVLDHVIVGAQTFVSMADRGLLT